MTDAVVTRLPNWPPPGGIGASDVAERAGITYRMLDHWLRTGYVTCAHNPHAGSGMRRYFTPTEAAHVHRVAELVRAGFIPTRAAELATELAEQGTARIAHSYTLNEASQ